MIWLTIIGLVIVIIYFLINAGNDKFWKLVNKYPTEAYDFLISNDCLFVIHPNELKIKPKDGNWTGPYFVPVPKIGILKIYGKENEFEFKQQEFIKMIEDNK